MCLKRLKMLCGDSLFDYRDHVATWLFKNHVQQIEILIYQDTRWPQPTCKTNLFQLQPPCKINLIQLD